MHGRYINTDDEVRYNKDSTGNERKLGTQPSQPMYSCNERLRMNEPLYVAFGMTESLEAQYPSSAL